MIDKPLLIIGIDPGTTVGYACLDIDGILIKMGSQKELDYSLLIEKLIEVGKPFVVATDKKRVPDFVEKVAVKTGSHVISPKEDLSVKEKNYMTSLYKADDAHQLDALAAALHANNSLTSIKRRVDEFVKANKREHLKSRILELVIKEGINIKSACYMLEHKDAPTEIVKKVVEEKKISKEDFLSLYGKLKDYEKTIQLLRKQNIHINVSLKRAQQSLKNMPVQAVQADEKLKLNIEHKEHLIGSLNQRIRFLEAFIGNMKKDLYSYQNILTDINSTIIVKKLKNLGSAEFDVKNKLLKIQQNDIIMVDEPDIASKNVLKYLEGKVRFIICKKKPNISPEHNFMLLDSSELSIKEDSLFATVSKESFEALTKKMSVLSQVVEQYKKERLASL